MDCNLVGFKYDFVSKTTISIGYVMRWLCGCVTFENIALDLALEHEALNIFYTLKPAK